MQAYRIVAWWQYEVTFKGRPATEKTPMKNLRKTPLIYVRFPVHRHTLEDADYRRMVKRAGNEAAACDGVYKALVGLAGNQVREKRGLILDDWQRPLDSKQVAELLCLPENQVSRIYAILMDEEVKWIELVEYPKSLHRSGKPGVSRGDSRGVGGVSMENDGVPLNETETEERLSASKRSETEGGDVSGEDGNQGESGGGGENVQPQARPPALASVSGSDSDTVPASVSEEPSVSGSAPAPASDSVSQPGQGAGPGADSAEPLTDKERLFEIHRECKKAVLELTQIIHPHNQSDITTFNDIYVQLQQRVISGCPYPLFELSLNTARQCWRGDKPIAMFVAAMKKAPFYYVPKKLSVVPGKFPLGKNNR